MFLMEYKWWILLLSEIIAWLATIYMCFARYWLQSKTQFIIWGTVAIITGYFPHITLLILDFLKYGTFHFFSIFVVILLLLGLTIFKKYIVLLDKWIQDWANKSRVNQKEK
ncbi:hypothetical protein [Neobacillus sp. D3-1R]|uniref:hypothetical protein n=1 Tax=Neobacillus sp. D3-1R TaxID=3445778 RepID=UPI003FA0CE76